MLRERGRPRFRLRELRRRLGNALLCFRQRGLQLAQPRLDAGQILRVGFWRAGGGERLLNRACALLLLADDLGDPCLLLLQRLDLAGELFLAALQHRLALRVDGDPPVQVAPVLFQRAGRLDAFADIAATLVDRRPERGETLFQRL